MNPGFHVVSADPGHTGRGAGGACVAEVRFPVWRRCPAAIKLAALSYMGAPAALRSRRRNPTPGGCVTSWRQQPAAGRTWSKESVMSVYRVTEIIGTSSTSWEDAAAEAIRTAAGTLRDLRVAEVVKQDIHLDEGGAITYRTKLQLSFQYEAER